MGVATTRSSSFWPTLPTIPTPRHGRGERVLPSIFQASRSQAKECFTHALQIQWQVLDTLRHQNTDNLPMGAVHSRLEVHVSSPIPDTHFAHQLTVLLHTRGRPFLLVHTTYKIGTFQWKPVRSHRRHNCGLQGSAYAHYTRAYLTSTVSATLASLLFLNTAQLPNLESKLLAVFCSLRRLLPVCQAHYYSK